MHSLMLLHTSQETQQSVSFTCLEKCERCRRVKTTTFVLPQALIASITSLPQQTTPEIKYFFDKGCKKAIITCPHTPGNTNNFYLLVRTDPSPSLENQLPTDAAVIVPFLFPGTAEQMQLEIFSSPKESPRITISSFQGVLCSDRRNSRNPSLGTSQREEGYCWKLSVIPKVSLIQALIVSD